MENWIKNNPNIFGKILVIVVFLFGICLIIGAFKDWDWLYAEEKNIILVGVWDN